MYVTLPEVGSFLWHTLRKEKQDFRWSFINLYSVICEQGQHISKLGELFRIWFSLGRLLAREFQTRWKPEANFMGVNWNWQRAISNSLVGMGEDPLKVSPKWTDINMSSYSTQESEGKNRVTKKKNKQPPYMGICLLWKEKLYIHIYKPTCIYKRKMSWFCFWVHLLSSKKFMVAWNI